MLKKILNESESTSLSKIFKDIIEMVELLTFKNEYNTIVFNDDFIEYVKDNFDENKNFSKMIMVIDNINNIMDSKLDVIDETQIVDDNDSIEEMKKSKVRIRKRISHQVMD